MSERLTVALETSPKRAFAEALEWPGWARAGKTNELAIEALLAGKPVPAETTNVFGCSTKWSDKREDAKRDNRSVSQLKAEIQALVKERKGAVQTPKQVIATDALPLTGLGKPDKKAVRSQYWMLGIMVGFTTLALWLLSQANQ